MPPELAVADEQVTATEQEQEQQEEAQEEAPRQRVNAERATAAAQLIEAEGPNYYLCENAQDMVQQVVDTHSDLIDAWGGWFLHSDGVHSCTGLTTRGQQQIRDESRRMSEALRAVRHSTEDHTKIFRFAPAVYSPYGQTINNGNLEVLLWQRVGEDLFAQVGDNPDGRTPELTLQLGVWAGKYDRYAAYSRAANYYGIGLNNHQRINRYLSRCHWFGRNDFCACNICTVDAAVSYDRVTAQWRPGQPVSRVISAAAKRAGFGKQALSQITSHMAVVGDVWAAANRNLRLSVSCHPTAFLRLGEPGFTHGDGTCYRNGSEWEVGKHGIMRLPNSVAFYWYPEDQWSDEVSPWEWQPARPIARAWGFLVPGQLVAATNFYGMNRNELSDSFESFARSEINLPQGRTRPLSATNRAEALFYGNLNGVITYLNSDYVEYNADEVTAYTPCYNAVREAARDLRSDYGRLNEHMQNYRVRHGEAVRHDNDGFWG